MTSDDDPHGAWRAPMSEGPLIAADAASVRYPLLREAFMRQYGRRFRARRLLVGSYGALIAALGGVLSLHTSGAWLVAAVGAVLVVLAWWMPRRAWRRVSRKGLDEDQEIRVVAGADGVRVTSANSDSVLPWSMWRGVKRRPDAVWLLLRGGATVLVERAQVQSGDLERLADAVEAGVAGGTVRGEVGSLIAELEPTEHLVVMSALGRWRRVGLALRLTAARNGAVLALFAALLGGLGLGTLGLGYGWGVAVVLPLAAVLLVARVAWSSLRGGGPPRDARVWLAADRLVVDPLWSGPAVFPLRAVRSVDITRRGYLVRLEHVVVPLDRDRALSGDVDALAAAIRARLTAPTPP
jgi:hypothetical protein